MSSNCPEPLTLFTKKKLLYGVRTPANSTKNVTNKQKFSYVIRNGKAYGSTQGTASTSTLPAGFAGSYITRRTRDVFNNPCVNSIIIYVSNHAGQLLAFDSDGNLKWVNKNSLGGAQDITEIQSSPTIGSDGTIYIGGAETATASGRGLHAFKTDGSQLWKADNVNGKIISSPVIGADGTIYVGSRNGKLYATTINGKAVTGWTVTTLGTEIVSSPAIDSGGIIYITSDDNEVYAINSDGTPKWTVTNPLALTTGLTSLSSIAIDSYGYIYAIINASQLVFGDRATVCKIDSDGVLLDYWNNFNTINSSIAITSNNEIISGGYIETMIQTWFPSGAPFDLGSNITSSPVIGADGTIYMGCDDGKLYAFNYDSDTNIFTKKWDADTGNDIKSSPAIDSEGYIYIGNNAGNLYKFDSNGNQKWVKSTGSTITCSPAIATYNEGKLIKTWYFTKNRGIRRYI